MLLHIDELCGDKLSYLVAKCLKLNMDDAGTFATWTGRVGAPGSRFFECSSFAPAEEYAQAAPMLNEMAGNFMSAGTMPGCPGIPKDCKYVCVRTAVPKDAPPDSTNMATWIAEGETFLQAACRAYCKWKLNSESADV